MSFAPRRFACRSRTWMRRLPPLQSWSARRRRTAPPSRWRRSSRRARRSPAVAAIRVAHAQSPRLLRRPADPVVAVAAATADRAATHSAPRTRPDVVSRVVGRAAMPVVARTADSRVVARARATRVGVRARATHVGLRALANRVVVRTAGTRGPVRAAAETLPVVAARLPARCTPPRRPALRRHVRSIAPAVLSARPASRSAPTPHVVAALRGPRAEPTASMSRPHGIPWGRRRGVMRSASCRESRGLSRNEDQSGVRVLGSGECPRFGTGPEGWTAARVRGAETGTGPCPRTRARGQGRGSGRCTPRGR